MGLRIWASFEHNTSERVQAAPKTIEKTQVFPEEAASSSKSNSSSRIFFAGSLSMSLAIALHPSVS